MESLGQYELLGVIGQGGMGRVYRARDVRYGRTVALKVMGADARRQPEFEKWFRREADLVTRMNSPHIVPIHGYGEVDGIPYLDMRWVDGHSLSSVVQEFGPASLDSALDILEQAASALDDAHAVGVIHRDVKPANLLIDRKGFCYLADFGIAVAAQHRSADGKRLMGSWAYMAPERFLGHEATSASDIYALGCVLHYALTGHPPFAGSGIEELRERHLHDAPPAVPGVSPQVEKAIQWALAKNPNDRPHSAGQWVTEIRDVQRRTQAPARLVSHHPARTQAQEAQRGRVLLVLLIALAILAGTLAALVLRGMPNG